MTLSRADMVIGAISIEKFLFIPTHSWKYELIWNVPHTGFFTGIKPEIFQPLTDHLRLYLHRQVL